MTLTPDLETLFRVNAHPLTKGMFEVWARLDQGEIIYDLDKDFSHISSMTLTLDQESKLKVTEHLLSKDTLWVKYDPD